jgi:carboxyl-terminal processing protease
MKRTISTGIAAWAAAMGMVLGALAETGGIPAGESGAGGLCEVVEAGLRLLEENRLAPDPEAARAALIEALVRSAEPSAEFLDDDGLADRVRRLSGREWDTGLTLVATEGLPKVAAVRAGSPAAAAGIQPGESIEKIDGREVPVGTRLQQVREWLAEGDDETLELGIRTAAETSQAISIGRLRRAEASVADIERLPAGMGYIRVVGLFPGAAVEISSALDNWQGPEVFGAILDLRGSAGAAEEEVAAVAARFAPEGAVLYTKADRQGRVLSTVNAPAAPVETLPMMVLIDEGTSGASELLAAVLGGNVKGTMLIGRETAGDPMIREPLQLPTGQHALLAVYEVRTADGTAYAGAGGVTPDVPITDAALGETMYEPDAPVLGRAKTPTDEEKEDRALRDRTRHDTYLRRATDMLLGLQALGYDRKR